MCILVVLTIAYRESFLTHMDYVGSIDSVPTVGINKIHVYRCP